MSSGRIKVDWSSMVSALAYDVNITYFDLGRLHLPSLTNVTEDEMKMIKARLGELLQGGNTVRIRR
jgi:hypothetical protein